MNDFLRRSRQNPQAILGGTLLIITLIVVAFGPLLAPYNPETFHGGHRLEGPSSQFLLGTDNFGRDLLSRVLYGARPTVLFGIFTTALGVGLGTLIGVISGYLGGTFDDAVMRVMDGLMAIPNLLLALLIITALGSSSLNAGIAVGLAFMPGMARITRSTTLAIRSQDYVRAAVARGEKRGYIVTREVLPNVFAPTIVEGTIRVAFAIMLGASLSFLGLGAQPPSSEWGLMVAEGRNYLFRNPWIVIGPGIAIAVVSISFNLLGDGLRDLLNPKVERAG